MTVGNNPTDRRSNLSTKRHILTDNEGIPLSVVISSANTHDIKLVMDVIDSMVVRPLSLLLSTNSLRRRRLQHLCLDKAYNTAQEEQKLIKLGYIIHISPKRKRGEEVDAETQQTKNNKKYPARRWRVVERTN